LTNSSDLLAALTEAREAFDADPFCNLTRLPARPFLNELRLLISKGSEPVAKPNMLAYPLPNGGATIEPWQQVAEELAHVAKSVFRSMWCRVMFTNRPWLEAPQFHVDEAAATLIVPIENAPTHYSSGLYKLPQGEAARNNKEAMTGMRAASAEGTIQTSDLDDLVLIKGLGWGSGHYPSVHSPPARPLAFARHGRSEASAFMIELSRQQEGPLLL
jgi:hypothetical protein